MHTHSVYGLVLAPFSVLLSHLVRIVHQTKSLSQSFSQSDDAMTRFSRMLGSFRLTFPAFPHSFCTFCHCSSFPALRSSVHLLSSLIANFPLVYSSAQNAKLEQTKARRSLVRRQRIVLETFRCRRTRAHGRPCQGTVAQDLLARMVSTISLIAAIERAHRRVQL